MHMTKHVVGVYSTEPGPVAAPPVAAAAARVPVVAAHDGPATVAAYSVVHERDGRAARALLVCDLPGGARTYATTVDPETCTGAETHELVGTAVRLESVTVDGVAGPALVNRASVAG
jgi:acetyl-CoA C-acetyltransferase